jgi:hypothetical protein
MAADLTELVAEARRLSGLIDAGVRALRESSAALAEAEHAYRRSKAEAWVVCRGDLAKEREAHVDSACADLRRDRDLREGERQAALEALRSRRVQLSALQSILAATRSEMELAR